MCLTVLHKGRGCKSIGHISKESPSEELRNCILFASTRSPISESPDLQCSCIGQELVLFTGQHNHRHSQPWLRMPLCQLHHHHKVKYCGDLYCNFLRTYCVLDPWCKNYSSRAMGLLLSWAGALRIRLVYSNLLFCLRRFRKGIGNNFQSSIWRLYLPEI